MPQYLDLGSHRPKSAILTGNPRRVEALAHSFPGAEFAGDSYGLTAWYANLSDKDDHGVAIVGVGMGGPSIAIVTEELIELGVETFMRIGTCGSLQDHVEIGDIVVPTGVVRDEGTSRDYVRTDYPAVPHHELLFMLRNILAESDPPHPHFGIVHCKDAFYTEKPDFALDQDALRKHWYGLRDANVLVTEMESSILFVIASLRKVRAMSFLVAVGHDRKDPRAAEGLQQASRLARKVLIAHNS